MSILNEATVPKRAAFFGSIAGEPGLGKSTLAALFPNPIFLAVEDGVQRIQPNIRPKALEARSYETIKTLLMALLKDEHDYQTLVIDSVTELDVIFADYVVSSDQKKPKSINQAAGGYGNGPKAVAAMHENFRRLCRKISDERGMNVVFIAHAATEKVDLPDKEPYMRYSFNMMKESVKPYIHNVDFVGFVRQEIFLRGEVDQRVKKAVGDGGRVLDCVSRPSTCSKNCYGIVEELPLPEGTNPLLHYINTEGK